METIATNVANAETTRTEAGGPYRRRVVEMQPVETQAFAGALTAASGQASDQTFNGVKVTGIGEDPTEGPLMYAPGHPDANADGWVRLPNVRVTDEMVDLMDARNLYQANATVFQAVKSMLRTAVDI